MVGEDEEGSWFAFKAGGVTDVGGLAGKDGLDFEGPHFFADTGNPTLHFGGCEKIRLGHSAESLRDCVEKQSAEESFQGETRMRHYDAICSVFDLFDDFGLQ